jgi:hypothetical protein
MKQHTGTNGTTVHPPVPQFLPDPDLIGNLEGNEDLAKTDAEAAREYVESVTTS